MTGIIFLSYKKRKHSYYSIPDVTLNSTLNLAGQMTKKFTISEEKLIEQLRQNQRAAFEYLYDHYSAALYGISFKILKEEEKAADALQDSFLKIWKNISSYSAEKGTLFTWMLNIARNTAIDKFRTESKAEHVVSWSQVKEMDLTPAAIFDMPLSTIDIRAIVGLLIPEKKVVIEMVYFQGYTHEEVSEKLNIPLGTVKSRVRRALVELRNIFDNRHPVGLAA
jgi:RNA polymerase sigma factor (sigma-70 family)